MRFSPDGKRFVAGDYPGGIVTIWDVATGKQIQAVETGYGYRGSFNYFWLTPDWKSLFVSHSKRKATRVEQDGKRLMRWEFDGNVRAWDTATGQLRKTYRHEPPRNVRRMQLSPDGTKFITFEEVPGTYERSPKQAVGLWDVATGRSLPLLDGMDADALFSPDSRALAVATMDKDYNATALKLFDTATAKEKWSVPVPDKDKKAQANFIAFSPDGRFILGEYHARPGRDWDKARDWLRCWDAADGHEIPLSAEKQQTFTGNEFSHDGRTWAVRDLNNRSARPGRVILYDVARAERARAVLLGRVAKGERLLCGTPAFSPNDKWLAVGTLVVPDVRGQEPDVQDLAQPRIHLIDVKTGEVRETLVAAQSFGRDAVFSPDGRTLATSGNGRVLLWDLTGLPGISARADAR